MRDKRELSREFSWVCSLDAGVFVIVSARRIHDEALSDWIDVAGGRGDGVCFRGGGACGWSAGGTCCSGSECCGWECSAIRYGCFGSYGGFGRFGGSDSCDWCEVGDEVVASERQGLAKLKGDRDEREAGEQAGLLEQGRERRDARRRRDTCGWIAVFASCDDHQGG